MKSRSKGRRRPPQVWYVYGYKILEPGHKRHGQVCRVGYTSNLARRHWQHERDSAQEKDKRVAKRGRKSKSGWYFYNAIRKYGFDKFELVVLRKCRSLESALRWEAKLIRLYKTEAVNGGFNEIPGGQASPMTNSDVVERMRKSCEPVWQDPAWRSRQGANARVVWADGERRARQSKTIRAAWEDAELKRLRSAISREVWTRPGYRVTNSAIHAKVWAKPERRIKQSKTIRQFFADRPDAREAKSQHMRAMWADPAFKRKMKAARAHIFTDPVIKKRHSENTAKAMRRPETKLKVRIGRLVTAIARQGERAKYFSEIGDVRRSKRAEYLLKCHERKLGELRRVARKAA